MSWGGSLTSALASRLLPTWLVSPARSIAKAAALFAVSVILTACAVKPSTTAPQDSSSWWTGRMTLEIEATPSQNFSALFELAGSPERGTLTLTSPLGISLARLQWEPGKARLESMQSTHEAVSLDSLLAEVAGTDLPVLAMFTWLQGTPVETTGWTVDLARFDEGRLTARRLSPPPKATLRLSITP